MLTYLVAKWIEVHYSEKQYSLVAKKGRKFIEKNVNNFERLAQMYDKYVKWSSVNWLQLFSRKILTDDNVMHFGMNFSFNLNQISNLKELFVIFLNYTKASIYHFIVNRIYIVEIYFIRIVQFKTTKISISSILMEP